MVVSELKQFGTFYVAEFKKILIKILKMCLKEKFNPYSLKYFIALASMTLVLCTHYII